jgi:hypothetical protein
MPFRPTTRSTLVMNVAVTQEKGKRQKAKRKGTDREEEGRKGEK